MRITIEFIHKPAFNSWFEGLCDPMARKRTLAAGRRFERGAFGEAKFFNNGAGQLKVDHGPEDGLYLAWRGQSAALVRRGETQGPRIGVTDIDYEFIPWEAVAYLVSDSDIVNYLAATFETGDAADITHAVATISRAKGITPSAEIADALSGTPHQTVRKAANPSLDTPLALLETLNIIAKLNPRGTAPR